MNFESTYQIARNRALDLMHAGKVSAYLQALNELKELKQLRTIGLGMKQAS